MQPRSSNTDQRGRYFSEQQKGSVWSKARTVPGLDSRVWRQDVCGARIKWNLFGVTEERGFGWEVDHITPVVHGGGDELSNLQALQWQNNREKGDSLTSTLNYCKIVYQH